MVDTLADTHKEAQAETLSHTQANVEIEALINIMADKLLERKAKTFLDTLGDVEAIKLLYTLAYTVGKNRPVNFNTLANTLKKSKHFAKHWAIVDRKTVQNPGLHSRRNERQNTSLQTGPCRGRGTA